MSNPATRNIEAYFENTYGLVYVFENSAGAAFDIASNFSTLSFKIFTKNNEASPLVELDLDSGFTISDTNRLTGEITAAQNETLFGSPIKYYQMTVTYSGDTETILKGIYVVNRAQSGSANDTALTLTVSLAPLEVSVSVADNAFLALQAKNEAEASATAASTSATNSSNSATASATSATNSTNSATASANSATASANSATTATTQAGIATTEANRAEAEADRADVEQQAFRIASLFDDVNNMKYGNIVAITDEVSANIPTPPSGVAYIFYDSGLKIKLSNGTIV